MKKSYKLYLYTISFCIFIYYIFDINKTFERFINPPSAKINYDKELWDCNCECKLKQGSNPEARDRGGDYKNGNTPDHQRHTRGSTSLHENSSGELQGPLKFKQAYGPGDLICKTTAGTMLNPKDYCIRRKGDQVCKFSKNIPCPPSTPQLDEKYVCITNDQKLKMPKYPDGSISAPSLASIPICPTNLPPNSYTTNLYYNMPGISTEDPNKGQLMSLNPKWAEVTLLDEWS